MKRGMNGGWGWDEPGPVCAKNPAEAGLLAGGSGEPDIEPISAAPVGLDELAPLGLCFEKIR